MFKVINEDPMKINETGLKLAMRTPKRYQGPEYYWLQTNLSTFLRVFITDMENITLVMQL